MHIYNRKLYCQHKLDINLFAYITHTFMGSSGRRLARALCLPLHFRALSVCLSASLSFFHRESVLAAVSYSCLSRISLLCSLSLTLCVVYLYLFSPYACHFLVFSILICLLLSLCISLLSDVSVSLLCLQAVSLLVSLGYYSFYSWLCNDHCYSKQHYGYDYCHDSPSLVLLLCYHYQINFSFHMTVI